MSPGSLNTKLFINYRREDTAPYAGRLYDRLVAHFGEDQVFIDIDQIDPGEDFVEVIHRKVGSCEIAIVAIGPNWLTAKDASGQRRLDDAEDFVRVEITAALERKIRVIPVLVGGARMPRRQDLPEALAPLSRRNAIELSETRFHADVNRLIEAIEKPRSLPEKKTEPAAEPVTLIAEPAPSEKMADPENLPETSALRPLVEPPPVPVVLITETAPPIKMADPENLPETSALRPRAEPTPVPAALTTETASPARLPDPENSHKLSAPGPAGRDQPPNPPPFPGSQARIATTNERRFAWILGDLAPRSQARTPTAKGSYLPWILLGLGCLAVLLLVIFVVSVVGSLNRLVVAKQPFTTEPGSYGKRLGYNGSELYYTSRVTEAEAKKLGEYLVKCGHFDDRPSSVQLNKTGTTYEIRACIKKGSEDEDSVIAAYKSLGHRIRLNVFDRRPVVVHLCDGYMKTLRVVTPDPITP